MNFQIFEKESKYLFIDIDFIGTKGHIRQYSCHQYTSPKLATVSTIFTHLLIFYICFSFPLIIIKKINFGKLCFRKKSSFVLFFVYSNICSLRTITRPSDTNDVNTTYVLHIPYGFQEFHFLLKFQFIHVQRAIKYNFVNSFVNWSKSLIFEPLNAIPFPKVVFYWIKLQFKYVLQLLGPIFFYYSINFFP